MKAIILTGCASGLGKAIHDNLISNVSGFRLIFLGRVLPPASKIKDLMYIKIDLACLSIETLSGLDDCLRDISELVFINNAGIISPITSHKQCDLAQFEKAVSVNFISPVMLIKRFLQLVKHVKVINISTGAAVNPVPYWGGYCSTKAAMAMFLNVLNLEEGVDVVNYDPGVIDTGMQSEIRQSAKIYNELKSFDDLHKNAELLSPQRVAEKICELIK
jgi:benzil reductase ((S)-benzoin forming)